MKKSDNTMAYSQLKSFNSQIVFLACQLIQNATMDCLISLEKIGDVGIEREENKIIELKNVDSNNNILSNSSVDLWKTIFNWAMFFYEHRDMDVDKFKLQLLVYTKNEYKSEIADAMNKCDNDKDFSLIEKEIMNKVLKEKPNKRSSLNSIIKNKEYDKGKAKYYIYCLFSKDLYKYFKKVVIKFRYVICKGTYRNSLLGLMKQVYGCKDHKTTEELAIKFLGWVNNKCQELMDQNEMVIIDSHEFSKFAKQYIGVFIDGERYRTHSFLEPSNKDITEEIFDNPKYIKQLDLINIGTNGKNMAAYVYLKLLLERKNWIESGFLSCIEDFKYVNYQKSVKRNWSEKEEFLYESDDVKKGQTLYQSINQNLDFGYFDGVDLDPNLKKGFIQELANLPVSNPLSIGWHPNYIDLLQDDEENEK